MPASCPGDALQRNVGLRRSPAAQRPDPVGGDVGRFRQHDVVAAARANNGHVQRSNSRVRGVTLIQKERAKAASAWGLAEQNPTRAVRPVALI
jgi:hypothetical protein